MEENKPAVQVTKRQLHELMQFIEILPVDPVNIEDFEDVTVQLFAAVDNHLKDNELLCDKDTFDFEDTTSSFELMDTKMDPRKQRFTVPDSPLFKQIKEGQLEELT